MTTRAYMSFGGGVQSTTLLWLAAEKHPELMDACGGVLPEMYVFADTGDEPVDLYPHIERCAALARSSGAHFEVARTAQGDLSAHVAHAFRSGQRRADIPPLFVKDAEHDRGIIVPRKCTRHFKIGPLTAFARHWFGVYRAKTHDGSDVAMWLGLSADEQRRLKVGRVYKQEWSHYFQPLNEMRWTRSDCKNYLATKAWPDGTPVAARRSACVFCPFHSLAEWRDVKSNPADWAKVLDLDDALEAGSKIGALGFRDPVYLNHQGVRMRDLDLTEKPGTGQKPLWDNECAGVCGV